MAPSCELRVAGCELEQRSAASAQTRVFNSKLETRNSKLPVINSQLETRNSKLPVINSKLETRNSKLPVINSKLETRNTKLFSINSQLKQTGFTLVEMVVVIAIVAIVGAMVAVFIRRPVESYVDSARRAELSDVADTALRRMLRDLRLALPNSVRVANPGGAGTAFYLEFLITSGGGRYRAAVTGAGTGDILDFTAADSSFDVLSPMPTFAGGESIVIYNLGTGFSGADAYAAANNNRAVYSSNNGTAITLTAAKLFPLASPGNRFHVVPYAVTYACDPVAREIRRYWNYGFTATQTPTPPAGGSSAQLARNVNDCTITYDQNAVQGRNGIVSLRLQLTGAGGEVVTLFQESHVGNVP